jgi:PEP-CTERM motif
MTRSDMSRIISLVGIAVALCVASPAHAAVIYGDIAGNTVSSGYSVGPGGGVNNAIAEGFTMTGKYNLQSVDVILSNFTPGTGSNLALSIYSDAGNKPGVDLYDLSTNITLPTSGSPTTVNLTGTGSFILNAGTKYWLDLYATNPASQNGNIVQWDGEINGGNATPIGPGATEIGQERSVSAGNPPSGPPVTNELRTAFQLNGIAVPEPATIALAAIAAAVTFAARRTRNA